MSGQIIQFDRYGDLPRGRLFRSKAVPRGNSSRIARTAPTSRDTAKTDGSAPKCDGLENRIARIGELLDELEQLTRTSKKFSEAALIQTRADIERARAIIRPLQEARTDRGSPRVVDGDPQPELDHEVLERFYRNLQPET